MKLKSGHFKFRKHNFGLPVFYSTQLLHEYLSKRYPMYFTPNFLPCILTFSKIIHSESVLLNSSDVYFKQTYRNRARILSSNGVANLIVPVNASSGKTRNCETTIDNTFPWQRTMLRTVQTAYRNSAYYQYYDYLFEP